MNVKIRLSEFGDSLIKNAVEICSSTSEVPDFVEFLLQKVILKCEECKHQFNDLERRTLAGIDKVLEHKNDLYSMQYKMAQTFGLLNRADEVCCPKCQCVYGYLSDD